VKVFYVLIIACFSYVEIVISNRFFFKLMKLCLAFKLAIIGRINSSFRFIVKFDHFKSALEIAVATTFEKMNGRSKIF
jgi:hypothetical protein